MITIFFHYITESCSINLFSYNKDSAALECLYCNTSFLYIFKVIFTSKKPKHKLMLNKIYFYYKDDQTFLGLRLYLLPVWTNSYDTSSICGNSNSGCVSMGWFLKDAPQIISTEVQGVDCSGRVRIEFCERIRQFLNTWHILEL